MSQVVGLLFSLALLLHCGSENIIHIQAVEKKQQTANTVKDNRNTGDEAYNFGIPPYTSEKKMKQMYGPIVDYLSEKLNKKVRFIVASDYSQLQKDLSQGIIHIAAFTAGAYSDALSSGARDLVYIATTRQGRQSYYNGLVVVKKDFKGSNLSSLKGKTFGFVEKGSSSGYKYPMALLLENGIDPQKDFEKLFFLGSHPSVRKALLKGTIDAGALSDLEFEVSEKLNPGELRVLARTPPIPFDAIVATTRMSSEERSRLQKVLVGMNKNSRTADGRLVFDQTLGMKYTGFSVRGPAFYNVVSKTARLIKEHGSNL